jgi:tetratricopeptide (TPR) repeat protein
MRTWVLAIVVGGFVVAHTPALAASQGSTPADSAARCEYGIGEAFAGEMGTARTAFLGMLGGRAGEARALNNLGNLSLLAGQRDVALAFYQRALELDSLDGGIRLNRATAYLLAGEDERAREEAADGIRLAGGLREASLMVGLRPGPEENMEVGKAAQRIWLSRQEMRGMLAAAMGGVPADSLKKTAASQPRPKPKGRARPVRPAGPRGAEDSDAVQVLYWKH